MLAKELIKKIRKIEIYTSRLVNNQMAGAYHSVFKGRGMSFDQVRQYQPGDEIRLIDWNVSARMNNVFVKVFAEEREMTVMLLVDMSESGLFGSQTQNKRELVAEMAAIMAFSAIKNNDRVGLIIFTDQVEKFLPPQKGKKHVLRVISEILRFEPSSKKTDITVALDYLAKITKRRSVAFLFSDFIYNPEDMVKAVETGFPPQLEKSLRVVSGKHDLVPVTVTDPLEEQFTDLGLVNMVDHETGEVILFDSSGPEAKQYAAHIAKQRTLRETFFRKHKLDFISAQTDKPYLRALIGFFQSRQKRRVHG